MRLTSNNTPLYTSQLFFCSIFFIYFTIIVVPFGYIPGKLQLYMLIQAHMHLGHHREMTVNTKHSIALAYAAGPARSQRAITIHPRELHPMTQPPRDLFRSTSQAPTGCTNPDPWKSPLRGISYVHNRTWYRSTCFRISNYGKSPVAGTPPIRYDLRAPDIPYVHDHKSQTTCHMPGCLPAYWLFL